MYEPLLLKTMTGQSKMMEILCFDIFSMLEKYLIQGIQVTCFEKLKFWSALFQTMSSTLLQVENNLGTAHY